LGLIPAGLANAASDAYREYRRMQHALRLDNAPDHVERVTVADRIGVVRALWREVFGRD
jgi:glutamate-ammonia-ligase adenylyltransferase